MKVEDVDEEDSDSDKSIELVGVGVARVPSSSPARPPPRVFGPFGFRCQEFVLALLGFMFPTEDVNDVAPKYNGREVRFTVCSRSMTFSNETSNSVLHVRHQSRASLRQPGFLHLRRSHHGGGLAERECSRGNDACRGLHQGPPVVRGEWRSA